MSPSLMFRSVRIFGIIFPVFIFLNLEIFGQEKAPGQRSQPDFFKGAAKQETEAKILYSQAEVLYFRHGMKKDREKAVEIWRRIALMQPQESSPVLNYIISRAALNSGEFEAARRAFIALGQVLPGSSLFRTANLESVVWQSPQASFAVRIVAVTGPEQARPIGSGTIISSDGWILTAAHVISNTEEPAVQFPDGTISKITQIHPGPLKADVVLVKVDRRSPPPPQVASTPLAPDEAIYSISFPNGCSVPVRSKGTSKRKVQIDGDNQYETTLSALPGSSGGGVFNQQGELVGVMIFAPKKEVTSDRYGTCGAVPLEDVKDLLVSWKTTAPFQLNEREKWRERSAIWSNHPKSECDQAFALFDSDPRKAISLFEDLYEDGNLKAGYFLGLLYCTLPQATDEDIKTGYDYFNKSSEVIPTSLALRGLMKLRGHGTKRDPNGGIEDLRLASSRGSGLASAHLALLYFTGDGVKTDREQAMLYADKAAETGHSIGVGVKLIGLITDFYPFDMSKPLPKDSELQSMSFGNVDLRGEKACKVFEYAQFASKQDAPMADHFLGVCYLNGVGTEADPYKAITLLENSANKGNATSAEMLGTIYFFDKGVPRDLDKCQFWAEKAAEKGSVNSKILYAWAETFKILKEKKGLLSTKSLKYLTEGCDANVADAQKLLGRLYLEGEVVAKDLSKSVELLEKAEKNGSQGVSAFLSLARFELQSEKKSSK